MKVLTLDSSGVCIVSMTGVVSMVHVGGKEKSRQDRDDDSQVSERRDLVRKSQAAAEELQTLLEGD